ncbi:MAG: glycine--tRNA ligase [Patescibacteria group bacterium]
MTSDQSLLEKIVSLCKRRGFIYPSADIYGGLAGFFDYGPYGLSLKNNLTQLWWKQFVTDREEMYGLDSAIVTKQEVLQASGHARGFADRLSECEKCQRRFRTDHLTDSEKCPDCGGKLGEARQFYLMLETNLGATRDESSLAYLRPETAQGIFTNFKNIVDSFHPELPFGIAQIGKAFRNEIAPRDFLFRVRELEQMEVEYFVKPEDWRGAFEMWQKEIWRFIEAVGIDPKKIHELEITDGDRAHYSKRTVDFEFEFPFGQKELFGLAYRTDHDLKSHMTSSGVDLSFLNQETNEKIVPHVIEPSLGVGRAILAVLVSAYTEDELGGEPRTFLRLPARLAPVRAAVFPLLKNKPELVAKARTVYTALKREQPALAWDDHGNIGKRYRRQDEIGTPACLTIDFQTLDDDTVTLRDRDTGKQERVPINELAKRLS